MRTVENLRTSKVPEAPVACDGCLVHGGFHATWRAIAEPVMAAVRVLRIAEKGAPVFVVGHSLGGALALFAALELAIEHDTHPAGVFTFGCPRVGNGNFSAFVRATLPTACWRVTHWKDPVPHLPFVRGITPGLSGFWHTPTEVFYDEASTTHHTCNGSGEDPRCSAQFHIGIPPDVNDHLTYFGDAGVGKATCAKA